MTDSLFSNWVIEVSSTIGTGNIVLNGAYGINQARFRDALAAGDVYYSVTSGANRECGIGVFDGSGSVARSNVKATLVNGVYNDVDPAPISLEGDSIIACTMNADSFHSVRDDIAQLRIDVDSNAADIIILNAGNSSLLTRVTVNEQNIASNDVDIANNLISIQTNESDIAALDGRVTANDSDIATNTANIATNIANIATNTADIDALQTDLIVLDADVSFRESAITALETGGTITQSGNTAILVAAGSGEIVDSYSDTEDQNTKDVSWLEQTFDLLANGGMPVVTGLGNTVIGIEDVSGSTTIKAYPGGITSAQRKVAILLGSIEYVDRVITGVTFAPTVSNQVGNTLIDLIDYIDLDGRIKGMVLRPTEIGDLSMWRDSGEVFVIGINYINAKDNQNVGQIAEAGAVDAGIPFTLIAYNNGTTAIGASVIVVPPDSYEENGAGVIDTLPAGDTVIHYLIESLSGSRYLSYGQQTYGTHASAVSNLFADKAAHLFPAETAGMIVLGQIVIDKGAAAWGLTAEIFPINSATSSGSSGGSASQAINISYSDTYNLGNNVQSALDTLASLKLTPDQYAAVAAAQAPTALNEFVTRTALIDSSLPINASTLDGLNSTDFLLVGGTAVNADLLDNLDSTQFLRSDVDATTIAQVKGITPLAPEDLTRKDYVDGLIASPLSLTLAIGNINQPLLDLPLNNSLAMKQGVGQVDHTRASTATYINRYGVLQTAAIDEPRFEKEGLLLEGPSTNLLLHSEEFTDAAWSIASGSGAFTANTDVAPDGSTTMDKLTAGSSNDLIRQNISLTDAATYTVSLWLKLISGTVTSVLIDAGDAPPVEVVGELVVGEAVRVIATVEAGANDYIDIEVAAGVGAELAFWGSQCEALPFASSYIRTGTVAVTREKDAIVVSAKNNVTNAISEQSLSFDFDILGQSIPQVELLNVQGDNQRAVDIDINGDLTTTHGAGPVIVKSLIGLENTRFRFGQTYTASLFKTYVDGIEQTSDTAANTNTAEPLDIIIGNTTTDGAHSLFGHLSNLRLWDRALNAQEMEMV